ncbi:protease inhibitor I42 family protein [Nocardia sp. NBC_01730]|uniref:protease inhibitor I42 family protein n=1 Tax=Nocardia sp. NBC_01730 TaxID=2975998 RepID=UPI002E12E9FB|nr:protease inhibitor I42 family protein [Nocardia sp. NBC_01730]
MRKSLLVLLLGLAVMGCGSNDSSAADPVVRVTDADNGQERGLHAGQRLVVTLPSNPSTGYSWRIAELDDALVKLDGVADFEPDPTVPVAPGSGGSTVWTFVGAGTGVAQLTMDYARPWEQGMEPTERFSLTIKVE